MNTKSKRRSRNSLKEEEVHIKKQQKRGSSSKRKSKKQAQQQEQEETKANEENQQQQQLEIEDIIYEVCDKKQKYTIQFGKRKYQFDISDKITQENKILVLILCNFDQFLEGIKKKAQVKENKITAITDHFNFTALEYFLYLNLENIDRKKQKISKMHEEEKCCICQFELYEKINDYSLSKFSEQLEKNTEDDVVGLSNCDSHFFHKSCLLMCIEEQHIKCPVCSRIYGVMTGDQPPGQMTHRVCKHTKCSGYEKCGTIVINYHFPSGVRKNGKPFSGTGRTAYLPDNKEGREVFKLLKIGFERKLLFTVGRSVTTGVDNTTVWNGVHHKTNTSGGAAYFGYPDPTYFDRVKLELAMKGVY